MTGGKDMSKIDYTGSEQFRPLSAWGYVGYGLLFSIPLVGFILLIVFSLNEDNCNRRNYVRSYFCWMLIAAIVLLVMLFLGLSPAVLLNRSGFLGRFR